MGAFPVRVVPVVLDATGPLPRNPLLRVCRRAPGVQLVVERPDAIPLQLQVEVAVHVLQEMLEPVGGRWLACQPIDLARVMMDHPPGLKLLVLSEIQLLRAQIVDLVLGQLLLISPVVVVDRNELIRLVGIVVQDMMCKVWRAVTTGRKFFTSS